MKSETTFRKQETTGRVASSLLWIQTTRERNLDYGASMHFKSNKDLSPEELETVKVSGLPKVVNTASVSIDTTDEATSYVKILDKFVTMSFKEDTPTWSMLGNLRSKWIPTWEEKWKTNSHQQWKTVLWKCAISVAVVVLGSSRDATKSGSADDSPEHTEKILRIVTKRRDLRWIDRQIFAEWVKEFTDGTKINVFWKW